MRLDVLYMTFFGWMTCWKQTSGEYRVFCYIDRMGYENNPTDITSYGKEHVPFLTKSGQGAGRWLLKEVQ